MKTSKEGCDKSGALYKNKDVNTPKRNKTPYCIYALLCSVQINETDTNRTSRASRWFYC